MDANVFAPNREVEEGGDVIVVHIIRGSDIDQAYSYWKRMELGIEILRARC